MYAEEPKLIECLEKQLRERNIHRFQERDSSKQLQVCRICQVLRVADYAFIQLADEYLDGFIVSGMAMAIGVKALPLRLEKYTSSDFRWAERIVTFGLSSLDQDLSTPLASHFNF